VTGAGQLYTNMSWGQDAATPVLVIDGSSSPAEPLVAPTGDDAEHDIPSS